MLAAILIGAALCLGVYSFILAIGSLRASEALAEYERAWGDVAELPAAARRSCGGGSSVNASSDRLTGHGSHVHDSGAQ